MPPVAVFDTNILFSATAWRGSPYRCLELARGGAVVGLTCPEILDELARVLGEKLAFPEEAVTATLTDLRGFLREVAITGTLKVVTADPDDDKVLECAAVGGAAYVVTGDRKHLLPLGSYQGIRIVSATEFLSAVAPAP
jgi:putative PIN family toxin of toxin-antitoxin system